MTVTTSLTERRPSPLSPAATAKRGRRTTPRRSMGQPAPDPRRRPLDRVAFGFCLGGIALGIAGCLVGASVPYHRPIAVAASTVRWGVYLSCLGAGVGGLVGLCGKRTPVAPPVEEGAGDPKRVES
jgi:hypothetical protein